MHKRARYAAGNWKMNGASGDMAVLEAISEAAQKVQVSTVMCLPATLVDRARNLPGISLGGQDCHAATSGAHTGDISAEMLHDAGARFAIVGHSERRTDHKETDADVAAKVQAAWRAGLVAIVCIGESEAQYRAGETLAVLNAQLQGSVPSGATPANTVIAYEPIWAIGTGLTPTTDEIQSVHAAIRGRLENSDLSVLYGGSVKPGNADDIFALPDVDGGLVGGASLTAEDFIPIIDALQGASA